MAKIDELLAIMAKLRDPATGCPWDVAQTLRTIVPHTLEEAYEVADAIERNDIAELRDELGDLLFQVVFYAQIAKETKQFEFDDVIESIVRKLIRRHPHVFGTEEISSAEAQTQAWEAHKAQERHLKAQHDKRAPSVLDGISIALPALSRAAKIQRRAARVNFDWPSIEPVVDKVVEELEEVRYEIRHDGGQERMQHEIGDLLFSCVNLSRHANIDPETALRQANTRFEQRFRKMETNYLERGAKLEEATLEEMEQMWQKVKQELSKE